jgi:arylsulfatase A-like enzyme
MPAQPDRPQTSHPSFLLVGLLHRIATLIFAIAIALHSYCPVFADNLGEKARSPNIVLILADDLGWQDTGFSGARFYETPRLDRLAREGIVFRQAYSSAGNCQPSRACLISGQYTPRHHVFAVGTTDRGPRELMRMVPVPNRSGLAPSEFTLAKAMQSAGYATGMFGKWHLGGRDGAPPGEQGFDVVDVSRDGWDSSDPADPKKAFSIATAACKFIERHRTQPFFLYLPHYAVHSGLQARPEVLAKFEQKAAQASGKETQKPLYAACISELDTSVGRVLDKLAELDLERNTLVVFTSDNGGTATSQEPLRGAKGGYYEGGIREPTCARWPAVVKPGTTCDVPIINVDFYATFADVAGAKLPADRPLDGASLVPLLRGDDRLARTSIYWHFPGYLDSPVPRGRDPVFRTRPVSVVRRGDWKLHLYHEEWLLDGGRDRLAANRAVELYNLADDPGEHRDLASSETARRDELLDDLLGWMDRVKAPLPTSRGDDALPAAQPKKANKVKAGKAK